MAKLIKKPFIFNFPLSHKAVRNLRIVTEHVGDLTIEGTAYLNPAASMLEPFERFSVDIDFVKWNGTDIKEVLNHFGNMDEIEEAAIGHAAYLFTSEIAA